VLVIQAGRIVEQGAHTELSMQNGLYARLYRSFMNARSEEELDTTRTRDCAPVAASS
jgi:hypothetical protein